MAVRPAGSASVYYSCGRPLVGDFERPAPAALRCVRLSGRDGAPGNPAPLRNPSADGHLQHRSRDRRFRHGPDNARSSVTATRHAKQLAMISVMARPPPSAPFGGPSALPVSFGGDVRSPARDHSARMAKKPVTFAAICRASSSAEVTPDARLPDLAGPVDQIVVC